MTQSNLEHGSPAAVPVPFSPVELDEIHAADRQAAQHIVGLMLSIFVTGVIGYLLICIWSGSSARIY